MSDKRSMLKGLKVGDLVYYRVKVEMSRTPTRAGACIIDKKRHGLIVGLDKEFGVGFQMMRVLWNDTTEIDTIAENYLHLINEA
jgi:hypothetical protein